LLLHIGSPHGDVALEVLKARRVGLQGVEHLATTPRTPTIASTTKGSGWPCATTVPRMAEAIERWRQAQAWSS